MKNVCAWCKKELDDVHLESDPSNNQITHGICESCKEYFFGEHTHTLQGFLNMLEAPVLMVNEDGDVLLANDQALQTVKKDLSSVRNLRLGNVVECAHARLPEGCGNTVHCLACTIRGNITKTFTTGKSLKRTPAFLQQWQDNHIQRTDYLISTEKVNKVVLLRIDEVIPKKTTMPQLQLS